MNSMERNRIKRTAFIAAAGAVAYLVGFLSTNGVAQTPAPSPDRFDLKVREDFFAGFGGDAARLTKAMKDCESELAAHPKNAEAMVWHGAGTFFLSGQAAVKGCARRFRARLRNPEAALLDSGHTSARRVAVRTRGRI
jgi:hypothetical protein